MKRLICLLLVLFLVVTAASAFVKKGAYPPNARPFGLSQTEWQVRFTRWWLSIPADRHPFLDTDGRYCQEEQSGPVFFLGSVFIDPGGQVTRSCTVPSGKAIYLPVTSSLCSPLTDGTTTPEESLECASVFADNAFDVFVEIDGVAVDFDDYRSSTPTFDALFPAGGLLGNPDPVPVEDIVTDGYNLMLPPQSVGQHVLRVGGKNHLFPGAFWDLTYHLTVIPAGKADR
jgi:hypothetical protein